MQKAKIILSALISLSAFVIIILSVKYFSTAPNLYFQEIKKGYKGTIVGKYFKNVSHLRIKTNTNEIIDVAMLTDSLINFSLVGDTIEKIPNHNYVILNQNGKKIKMAYVYIPDYFWHDGRWPKEWKDR